MDIVINHLTRMRHGAICMAGVEPRTQRHVRPKLPGVQQLTSAFLRRNGGPVDIGSVLRFSDIRHRPVKPEREDHLFFGLDRVTLVDTLAADAFWRMLQQQAKPRLAAIFGPELRRHGPASCVVDAGKGSASLGCLIPSGRPAVRVQPRPDKPAQVRMNVSDGEFELDLGVTDIRLYGADHATPDAAQIARVHERFQRGLAAILCVGLSRVFRPSSDVAAMHWLQVNNIHFAEGPLWQLA